MSYLGPVLQVASVFSSNQEQQQFFYASGPFLLQHNQGYPRNDEKKDSDVVVVELPEGRIISTFELDRRKAEISGFVAAHNEVFYFCCSPSFPCSSSAPPELQYCGRTLDKVLKMRIIIDDNERSPCSPLAVVCLGHEGVVCQFEKSTSSPSSSSSSSSPHSEWNRRYLCTNSPLGMCLAGAIISSENNKSNQPRYLLGTSSGDVVEFETSSPASSFSRSRMSKCHENGMVYCMSDVAVRKADRSSSDSSFSFFATASDERRASLVIVRDNGNNSQDAVTSATTVIRLPFEPGRIRSVDCVALPSRRRSSHQEDEEEILVATGCEDGWIRCYKIPVNIKNNNNNYNSNDDGNNDKISSLTTASSNQRAFFGRHVHGGGIGGGASSLKIVVVENRTSSISILSGGFDGKICLTKVIDEAESPAAVLKMNLLLPPATADDVGNDAAVPQHDQIRCLTTSRQSVANNDGTKNHVVAVFAAFAGGDVWMFDPSKKCNAGKVKICSLPAASPQDQEQRQAALPCSIATTESGSGGTTIFVGTTNGDVFECSDSAESSASMRLVHSHRPQRSTITSLDVGSDFVLSCAASGSIVLSSTPSSSSSSSSFTMSDCSDKNNISSASTATRSTVFAWADVCQGRSIILPPRQRRNGTLSSSCGRDGDGDGPPLAFIASDRRGVYVLSVVNNNDGGQQCHKKTKTKKIYNSSDAFPGRADLWCPSSLHWEPSDDEKNTLRFCIVHKNRMFQVFEIVLQTEENQLIFASVPSPICPDLPVRDVLFSSENFALVHSGSHLVFWDRKQNRKFEPEHDGRDVLGNDMNATRLRAVRVFENDESDSKNDNAEEGGGGGQEKLFTFVWSNDSKEVQLVQFPFPCKATQRASPPSACCWGSCDLTCCCSMASSTIFVTGGDDGVLSVWSLFSSTTVMTKLDTLHLHSSSVLALCGLGDAGFASVGAHATIGVWRRTSRRRQSRTSSSTSSSSSSSSCSSFDLCFSKVAAPLAKNTCSGGNLNVASSTRSREAELERFISCDAYGQEVIAVGSSCGDFLLLRQPRGGDCYTFDESRFSVTSSSSDCAASPIISVGVVVVSVQVNVILVVCGLNNGRLMISEILEENGVRRSIINCLSDNAQNQHDNDNDNNNNKRKYKNSLSINEGAVSALKILSTPTGCLSSSSSSRSFVRVCCARESGGVFVVDVSVAEKISISGTSRFDSHAAATPRVVLSSPLCGKTVIAVVEEGRRISFHRLEDLDDERGSSSDRTTLTQQKYSSVVRVRGACVIHGDDARAVIVIVGQGMQLVRI